MSFSRSNPSCAVASAAAPVSAAAPASSRSMMYSCRFGLPATAIRMSEPVSGVSSVSACHSQKWLWKPKRRPAERATAAARLRSSAYAR
jgi:hypothetical protein